MKMIVGRKLNMTQIFDADGKMTPVTAVRVSAGAVTQVKTAARDGYAAVQLGFNEGAKHTSRAVLGHVKNLLARPVLRELRLDNADSFKVGGKYDLANFSAGDIVSVTGVSKGKGFAGVVKRHHFHGSPKTHGHKHDLRAPGSIGSTDAQRVFPGRKMAGRLGGEQATIKNLQIAKVDAEQSLLYIKGAVPGARNGLVIIKGEGEMKAIS